MITRTPLFWNARVTSTRVNGTPVYSVTRRVQIDDYAGADSPKLEDNVPHFRKYLYDDAGSLWQRGDICVVQSMDYFTQTPLEDPFHVASVIQSGWPLPATEVYLARVNFLFQTVTYWKHAVFGAAGVTRSPGFQTVNGTQNSFSDGSFGTGVMVSGRGGYYASTTQRLGVIETQYAQQWLPMGLSDYQSPVIVFESPLVVTKGDLIGLADGRRLVVADGTTALQVNGVTIGTVAPTERRELGNIIYSVPI